MMFASDLDRTLIYSNKFIDERIKEPSDIRLVELYNGKEITYMLEKSIETLKKICERALFVPVTTRTIEQYRRIMIFNKEILPKYSVVTNGGNILADGAVDQDWNRSVKQKIGQDCLALEDAVKEFERIKNDQWVHKLRIADEMFFYCVIDNSNIPSEELNVFSKALETNNWRTILHGRKLYFLPNCVNKGHAVKHLAEKEEKEHVIAAGDSILDLDMLHNTKHFISPQHGDIFSLESDKYKKELVKFTENHGILAGSEILETVLQLFS